ncbi:hypothetical protein [Brevibacillus fulvus]|uniref:Spore coat protein n=1 Tax=Brevibacillus fulvus TaxID=1125967 RepID=A0A938Y1J2_9BACL|nr:hypothetical protein [Brevibacillus fulvus]MBM7590301.1 hypothetical protein [Brevibacillus fulvus]
MAKQLAFHETMELTEIMNFKSVCLTKSTVSQALVTDEALRSLLQQDVQTTQRQIGELQGFLS